MTGYKYIDESGQHLHTFDGRPLIGTSSVADVLAKPLTWWASGLAVKEFGVVNPKVLTLIKNKKASQAELADHVAGVSTKFEIIKKMSLDDFLVLVDRAYRAHATTLKDKASEGTDLHASLEEFVKNEMTGDVKIIEHYNRRIHPFIEWARVNVKRYLWSEMYCFSKIHGMGGISDLGVELNDSKIAVVDFKSSKEAYLSQFWQCAGYSLQIEENGGYDRDGNKVFEFAPGEKVQQLIVVPFGMDAVYPQVNIDIDGGKEAFLAELLLYKKLLRD